MNRSIRRPVALLALALLAACEDPIGSSKPLEALPRPLTAGEREIIGASNRFAFDLLREVNRGEEGRNVFLSPLSASMALGMTMNGARGSTLDAMRSTLGFGTLPLGEIDRSYRSLIDLLTELDPGVDIRLANAIWYRSGFPLETAFADTTRRYFDARVTALNFADPSARTTINGWVKESTNGKIETIVDGPIPGDVMLYLMNAIYFKGSWTDRFDPARTTDATFTAGDGSRSTVRMMSGHARYGYGSGPEYEILDLPYGNGAFSMTVLLPRPGHDADALLASLDAQKWADAIQRLTPMSLDVHLPRFKLEYQKGLVPALRTLGMGIAFTPASDFTALSAGDPWIDQVLQKTYVEVNEEGTEAAAVTSVVMVTSLPPTVRVDRPFVFALRERFSGTILFMGKIERP